MDPVTQALVQIPYVGGVLVLLYGFLRWMAPRLVESFRLELRRALRQGERRRRREHVEVMAAIARHGCRQPPAALAADALHGKIGAPDRYPFPRLRQTDPDPGDVNRPPSPPKEPDP